MAREQDILQLPYKRIDYTDPESMAMAIQRNFNEIERYVSLLQGYVKTATGTKVADLPNVADIWDRANNITAEGKFLTSKLLGAIETSLNLINAGAGCVTITDNNGILITDLAENPTKALRLLGGVFAIANSKTGGNWNWRTFGTGDGFIADEIISGSILTSLINIVGDKYYTKILGDGFRVYNKNGSLAGHFGNYETLTTQTAAFTRATTAYGLYGNAVASGIPRYEYTALPKFIWQDLFDTDQLTKYTSGGDTAATWAVSGGMLTGTGGTQATLIKDDLLLQNCEIVINSNQAYDGGIIARYQDNNNYYMLALRDDSGIAPNENLCIYKRVGGTFTSLVSANVTWPRGTSKQIKFTLHGSRLEAWFDGVKVISITDTTFTGGGVGFRNSSATAFQVWDFTVKYASPGVMMEEGCTNIVADWPTGWTISGDAGMSATSQGAQDGAALTTMRLANSGATEGFYQSALFALSPSTKYTLRFKVRGTVGAGKLDAFILSNTGTLIQLNGSFFPGGSWSPTLAWQTIYATFTTTADITGTNQHVRFDHDGNDAGYIDLAEITLIQKPYALTFPGYNATRNNEVMTAPTANVFTKSNWTVETTFRPTSVMNVGNVNNCLWMINIDANNYYMLGTGWFGELYGRSCTNGTIYNISSGNNFITPGNDYSIMLSGNGSVMQLACNGVQQGSDTAYVEPVGALPANMYIGSNGTEQANGIISNFAVMNKAQTISEYQAKYNTGLPLNVDEWTTCLMTMYGTLKPTIRQFGLLLTSGEIYASKIRTGTQTTGDYITLEAPNTLKAVYNNTLQWELVNDGIDVCQKFYTLAGALQGTIGDLGAEIGIKAAQNAVYLNGAAGYGVTIGSNRIGSSLTPKTDQTGEVGDSNYRWFKVRAMNFQTGDICFSEKSCPICNQPFASGDILTLYVHTIHEELDTMCIPIHDKCKDTPAEITVQVPEVITKYNLNEEGEIVPYRATKFKTIQKEVKQLKPDYSFDEEKGVFKKGEAKVAKKEALEVVVREQKEPVYKSVKVKIKGAGV
jgi:hypothetical protein